MDQDGDSEMLSSSNSSPSSATSNNQPTIPQTPTAASSSAPRVPPEPQAQHSMTPMTSEGGLPTPGTSQATISNPMAAAAPSASASASATIYPPPGLHPESSQFPHLDIYTDLHGNLESSFSAGGAAGTLPGGTASSTTEYSEDTYLLHGEPGAAWNNRQAQEDYRRAMETVVDRDFSLDAFGDPFDERDMAMNA